MRKAVVVLFLALAAMVLYACGGGSSTAGTGTGGGQTSTGGGHTGTGGPAFTIGGTVVGLTGTGLVLQDNAGDNLTVSASGAFAFPTPLADGAPYSVSVLTQPGSPSQTCTVSGGTYNNSSPTAISLGSDSAPVHCSE